MPKEISNYRRRFVLMPAARAGEPKVAALLRREKM